MITLILFVAVLVVIGIVLYYRYLFSSRLPPGVRALPGPKGDCFLSFRWITWLMSVKRSPIYWPDSWCASWIYMAKGRFYLSTTWTVLTHYSSGSGHKNTDLFIRWRYLGLSMSGSRQRKLPTTCCLCVERYTQIVLPFPTFQTTGHPATT